MYIQRGKSWIYYANQFLINLLREMHYAVKTRGFRQLGGMGWLGDFSFNNFKCKSMVKKVKKKVPNYRYQNGDANIKHMALIAALRDHKELEAYAFNP